MPESNPRYHQIETASAYQEKIESRRKLSGWLETRMLKRSLAEASGDSVLDCPCGTGRIDAILRQRFAEVTGVDSAAAMLEIYKRDHPGRQGQVADVFDLPFEDGQFDWVVCHRLMHHFKADEDRLGLLNSLARVTKYGVSLYCWLEVPLSRRGRGRERGRQSMLKSHFENLLVQTPLELQQLSYAAWPFSPKVIATCRKQAP